MTRVAKACISLWMILSVFFVATWTSLISTKLTTARLSAQNVATLDGVSGALCARPTAAPLALSLALAAARQVLPP